MEEVQLTQELVRIDSQNPPGNEKQVAKYIFDYLDGLRIDTRLVEFGSNRYSVVASVGKGNGLMFNTHIDTVPVGDLKAWKYDPFSAKIVGDKIYGRGASDSKSGVAAILTALKNNVKRNFKRKLLIALVGDEEVAQGGSKYLIKNRGKIFKDVKYGLIADSDYDIAVGQKGILHVKFVFHGKAAHGSEPEKGVNAITKATKFVSSLEAIQSNLKKHKDVTLGYGTINVGKISGGTKVNIVADKCEVEVDRRLTWGETPNSALNQFKNLLRKQSISAEVKFLNEPRLAVKTAKDSKLVEVLKSIDGKLKVGSKSGYTEMELYIRELSMECVACGPIEKGQAHVNDEFVKISSIKKTTKLYTDLIRKWCC